MRLFYCAAAASLVFTVTQALTVTAQVVCYSYPTYPSTYSSPVVTYYTQNYASSCPSTACCATTGYATTNTTTYCEYKVVTDSCGNQRLVAVCKRDSVATTAMPDRRPDAIGEDTQPQRANSAKWTAVKLNNVNDEDLQFCLTYKSGINVSYSPCYFVPRKTTATVFLDGYLSKERNKYGQMMYVLAVESINPRTGERQNLGSGFAETEARFRADGMLELSAYLALRNPE